MLLRQLAVHQVLGSAPLQIATCLVSRVEWPEESKPNNIGYSICYNIYYNIYYNVYYSTYSIYTITYTMIYYDIYIYIYIPSHLLEAPYNLVTGKLHVKIQSGPIGLLSESLGSGLPVPNHRARFCQRKFGTPLLSQGWRPEIRSM